MKANEKVYLVESSFGQYDDHYMKTEGVFTDPTKAEELKAKILAEIESYKDLEEPVYPDDIEMTEEQYKTWEEWFAKHGEAYDFNGCYVREYVLNERIK
jgi:hypothetical protein